MTQLALMGVWSLIALAFNTTLFTVLAAFHGHKITLEFNRFHEHNFEIVLCIACFAWGIWGVFYLSKIIS